MTSQSKLSKDQIQKLVLTTLGFAGVLYVYSSFFLGPLNKSRAAAEANIAQVQAKIASSKSEITKATNLEQQAVEATAHFAALKASSPEGAPIAWFPPRMKAFFASQQIDRATARLEGSSAFKQPELAEWNKYAWLIDLPQSEFGTVGRAIAQLENTEPLLNITRISIKADANEPQYQQVSLTAHTTVLKR